MRQSLLGAMTVLAFLASMLLAADQKNAAEKKNAENGTQRLLGFDIDRLMQEYDTNKDGFLQHDELPTAWRDHFDELDSNKDGKLSRDELERGLVFLQPRRRPADVVFVLIEMSDCDECCAGELQTIYDSLRKLDKNKDGKIDAEELTVARQEIVEDRVNNIFKALDQNKDGKISRAEARGLVKENFDRLDTNKDGFLEREELLRAASEKPVFQNEPLKK